MDYLLILNEKYIYIYAICCGSPKTAVYSVFLIQKTKTTCCGLVGTAAYSVTLYAAGSYKTATYSLFMWPQHLK